MKDLHWELSTLYEISRLLSASPALDDLVEIVVKAATALGNAEASWLALWDEQQGRLSYAASHKLTPETVEELSANPAEWLPFDISKPGGPAVLTDLDTAEVLRHASSREGVGAAVVAPITYQEALTGVLAVFWSRSSRLLSERIEPIFLLANQAGPAVQNARLLGEAQRQSAALSAVFKVGQTVGASPRMSWALNVILDEANRLFGTDLGSIRLIDPNTKELVIRASRGLSKYTVKRIRLRVGEGVMGWVAQGAR